MARSLIHIHEEVVRASELFGVDPRELRKKQFLSCSEVTDYDLRTYGGFAKVRADAAHSHGVAPKKNVKESRGVDIRNNYVRSLERKVATADYLGDKLLQGMQEVFEENKVKFPRNRKLTPKVKKHKRTLTLLLSDLHFGLDVDGREIHNSSFNWEIASRRIAKCCQQAALWKPEHRHETNLQVVFNGDILAGVIHLSEANLKEIQEQIWGATAILSHALDFLSTQFGHVNVLCLPGNHDRMTYRSSERAVAQRWNSHAHSVFMGLKIWFRENSRVSFDVPMSGMGTYTTPGNHLIFATHGDTEPATSNVGKSFDVGKTTQAILKMHAGGALPKKIDVVLFGHWHQPSMFMLPDGTTCVINGALIGSDSFAQNGVGIFNAMPAQVMFESVEGYPVGDFRILKLRDADHDASLDNIVNIPDINDGGLIEF